MGCSVTGNTSDFDSDVVGSNPAIPAILLIRQKVSYLKYRVYKGEEYYGRNMEYIGTSVLVLEDGTYVGTYSTPEELEEAKIELSLLHNGIEVKE